MVEAVTESDITAELSTIVHEPQVAEAMGRKLTALNLHHIEKQLGRGATGIVYQLRGNALFPAEKLALKVTPFSPNNKVATSNEVTALTFPHHPNLCRAYAVLTYDGKNVHLLRSVDQSRHGQHILLGIFSEAVQGTTLHHQIRRGPLPEASIRKMGAQLASALHTLHAAGYAHKDIHTENILLSPDRVKLIDFNQTTEATPKRVKSDWKRFGDLLAESADERLLFNPYFYDLLFSQKHGLLQGVRPYTDEQVVKHPFFNRTFTEI